MGFPLTTIADDPRRAAQTRELHRSGRTPGITFPHPEPAMKTATLALLVVLLGACGTYRAHDRYHERDGQRVYGASAPVEGHELVCHMGMNTLSLPSGAIPAHLDHGDRRGAC
jgi:hypothetical protein